MSLLAAVILLTGCVNAIHDPNGTGLRIKPPPGFHEGPIDLLIANRTGGDISCQVVEVDNCPTLAGVTQERVALEAGERWTVEGVECADVDILCLEADATAVDLPIRTWRWFVQPLDEE